MEWRGTQNGVRSMTPCARVRALTLIAALVASVAPLNGARVLGASPIAVQVQQRYTLASPERVGTLWVTGSAEVDLRLTAGNSATLTTLSIATPGTTNVGIPVPPFGTALGTLASATAARTSASALTAAGVDLGNGRRQFTFIGVTMSMSGTASHSASGLACNNLLATGSTCSGSYTLAQSGTQAYDLVARVPGDSGTPGTFSMSVQVALPLNPLSPTIGTAGLLANIEGALSTAPTCVADFNQSGRADVQDIFSFLNAWFAKSPSADINAAGGITVQDIFDFLAAWFRGC